MKTLVQYIIEGGTSNEVPVKAFWKFLKEVDVQEGSAEYWYNEFEFEYGVSADIAKALIDVVFDGAIDDVVEFDAKIMDDLFGADKIIKKEVKTNNYIAVRLPREKKAYAVPFTNQTSTCKAARAVLDNIKWTKGGKWDVAYNF